MMSILSSVFFIVTHPIIHLYHDRFYKGRKNVPSEYDRMFWHGQHLNESAYYYTGIMLGCSVEWAETFIEHNGYKGMAKGHGDVNCELVKNSKFLTFLT